MAEIFTMDTNMKVIVRLCDEQRIMKASNSVKQPTSFDHSCISIEGDQITIQRRKKYQDSYEFSSIYPETVTQEDLYNEEIQSLIEEAVMGKNISICTMGSIRSGKTYTMMGPSNIIRSVTRLNAKSQHHHLGIIPRALHTIYETIDRAVIIRPHSDFYVEISFIELHENSIKDLLIKRHDLPAAGAPAAMKHHSSPLQRQGSWDSATSSPTKLGSWDRSNKSPRSSKKQLTKDSIEIHENPHLGVYFTRCNGESIRIAASTIDEALSLFALGCKSRSHQKIMNNNYFSSKSHAIFTIYIEQRIMKKTIQMDEEQMNNTTFQCTDLYLGKLHLIDLAGSIPMNTTTTTTTTTVSNSNKVDERLKETQFINSSLNAFGEVLRILSEKEKSSLGLNSLSGCSTPSTGSPMRSRSNSAGAAIFPSFSRSSDNWSVNNIRSAPSSPRGNSFHLIRSNSSISFSLSSSKKQKQLRIPYLNSKLTHVLKEALGGNCKTVLIATVNTSVKYAKTSATVLKYANWAKDIKCRDFFHRIDFESNESKAMDLDDNAIKVCEDIDKRSQQKLNERSLQQKEIYPFSDYDSVDDNLSVTLSSPPRRRDLSQLADESSDSNQCNELNYHDESKASKEDIDDNVMMQPCQATNEYPMSYRGDARDECLKHYTSSVQQTRHPVDTIFRDTNNSLQDQNQQQQQPHRGSEQEQDDASTIVEVGKHLCSEVDSDNDTTYVGRTPFHESFDVEDSITGNAQKTIMLPNDLISTAPFNSMSRGSNKYAVCCITAEDVTSQKTFSIPSKEIKNPLYSASNLIAHGTIRKSELSRQDEIVSYSNSDGTMRLYDSARGVDPYDVVTPYYAVSVPNDSIISSHMKHEENLINNCAIGSTNKKDDTHGPKELLRSDLRQFENSTDSYQSHIHCNERETSQPEQLHVTDQLHPSSWRESAIIDNDTNDSSSSTKNIFCSLPLC